MARKVIGFVVSVLITGCTPIALYPHTSPIPTPQVSPLVATLGYFCENGETRVAWYVENTSNETLGYQVFFKGEQIASSNIGPHQKHNGNHAEASGIGEYIVTSEFGRTQIAVLQFDTSSIVCDK